MSTDAAFLGRGWSFPPTFQSGGGEVVMVSGVEDIHQSLQILLSTRLGERVMQDEFGCPLDSVIFEEIDQGLINTLNRSISDAILYYEPRITLEEIDVDEDMEQPGLLLISIAYTVRSTNSRFNLVYPFYINEAMIPA